MYTLKLSAFQRFNLQTSDSTQSISYAHAQTFENRRISTVDQRLGGLTQNLIKPYILPRRVCVRYYKNNSSLAGTYSQVTPFPRAYGKLCTKMNELRWREKWRQKLADARREKSVCSSLLSGKSDSCCEACAETDSTQNKRLGKLWTDFLLHIRLI